MQKFKEGYNMKTVYLIGGTMGVGKTTVCQLMKAKQKRKNSCNSSTK
jgi:broad-specificity NMP kinase